MLLCIPRLYGLLRNKAIPRPTTSTTRSLEMLT